MKNSTTFPKTYKHLYNSVSYDTDGMSAINAQINKHIKNSVAYDISVDEIAGDVQCMKLGKLDGGKFHGANIMFNSMLISLGYPDSVRWQHF